jgi:hypothetical protein
MFAQTHLSNIGAPAHSHAREHSVGGQAFLNSPIYVLSFVLYIYIYIYMLVNTLSESKNFLTGLFSPLTLSKFCYFPTLFKKKKSEIALIFFKKSENCIEGELLSVI